MEHKVPHYLGMWAGNKIYLNQITGQQEYDNTMDTWMNLSLQKERGWLKEPYCGKISQ